MANASYINAAILEPATISGYVLEGFVIHLPPYLYKAPMLGKYAPVDLGRILRAAVRVVNAAIRWSAGSDGCFQRRNGQPSTEPCAPHLRHSKRF
jgi:hypothetical protein